MKASDVYDRQVRQPSQNAECARTPCCPFLPMLTMIHEPHSPHEPTDPPVGRGGTEAHAGSACALCGAPRAPGRGACVRTYIDPPLHLMYYTPPPRPTRPPTHPHPHTDLQERGAGGDQRGAAGPRHCDGAGPQRAVLPTPRGRRQERKHVYVCMYACRYVYGYVGMPVPACACAWLPFGVVVWTVGVGDGTGRPRD